MGEANAPRRWPGRVACQESADIHDFALSGPEHDGISGPVRPNIVAGTFRVELHLYGYTPITRIRQNDFGFG
jgi:hypothetical protein